MHEPPLDPRPFFIERGRRFESVRGLRKSPGSGAFLFGSLCTLANVRYVWSPLSSLQVETAVRRSALWDQIEFLGVGEQLGWLHGTRTSDELSALLGLANLFSVEPIRGSSRLYRRWAFESAGPWTCALRQRGLSLDQAVGGRPGPSASWRRSGSGSRRACSRSESCSPPG